MVQIGNMKVSMNRILEGTTIVSFGMGLIAIIASALAFNSDDFYHDDKLGIEFGIEVDLSVQETNVWARIPAALYVRSSIGNVMIFDKNGGKQAGEFRGLFPVSGPTKGYAEINFEIFAADDDQMPDLSKHDQSVIPLAYIRESSRFPPIKRYLMIGFATLIKHWAIAKIGIIAGAVGFIAAGIGLRILNKKSSDPVIEIKDE